LGVAEAGVVEDLQLGLVGFGDVGKVLLVVGVDTLGVGLVGAVAEVVPRRARQGELDVAPLLLRD